jgi:hypothetical protein
MRFLPAALAASALFAQAPRPGNAAGEPPRKARLEGSVVSAAGQPVARATVRLLGLSPLATATPPMTVTSTNDAGVFVFEQVEPGPGYQLLAERPGFVPGRYGARSPAGPPATLAVAAGQEIKGLTIVMTPQGVISGRVTDQNGDFVQGVQVRAVRRGFQRGVRTLVQVGGAATNDLGEYRIANLPPGRVYVVASGRAPAAPGTGQERETNLTTFFPKGLDERSAAPIEVAPGADIRGIDIRLQRGPVFSISGKALDAASGDPARVALSVISKSEAALNPLAGLVTSGVTAQSRDDGSFVLRGLAPGAYVVQTVRVALNGNPLSPPPLMGRAEVTITDDDITDFVLPLSTGATIEGAVRLEEGDIRQITAFSPALPLNAAAMQLVLAIAQTGAPLPGIPPTVALLDASGASPPGAQIKEDGSFILEGVPPSRFGVSVNGLPAGVYLKSATLSGQDVLRAPLDLTAGGGGRLDLLLSRKAASIAGVARNQKGEAMAGVAVTLWSATPESGSPTNGVRTTNTDPNGAFRFTGLPPGEYRLAAWEDAEPGLLQNREFLALFAGDSEEIDLSEGAQAAQDLKMIPAAEILREAAKLP